MLIHSLEILEISITQTKEVHFVSPTTDIRNQEFLLKKKKKVPECVRKIKILLWKLSFVVSKLNIDPKGKMQ